MSVIPSRPRFRFLKRLYDWTIHWAHTRHAAWALFLVAFAESSFFPIPPDVLLIALLVGYPSGYLRLAAVATAGSVLGGMAGYGIGFAFYETIGRPIITWYHLESVMTVIGQKYHAHAFFTIFTAAFTPIPYKVITIAAGVFHIPFWTLVIASFVGRGLRFFIEAIMMRLFGKRMSTMIEKYFDLASILFVVLLLLGFLLLKFIF